MRASASTALQRINSALFIIYRGMRIPRYPIISPHCYRIKMEISGWEQIMTGSIALMKISIRFLITVRMSHSDINLYQIRSLF